MTLTHHGGRRGQEKGHDSKSKGNAQEGVQKAISDLVTQKHANYGNVIEYNAYIHAIAKLRAIEKTVNPGALRMAVHWNYWSMGEVSAGYTVPRIVTDRVHSYVREKD